MNYKWWETYNPDIDIKFKMSMIRLVLRDYSAAYIYVKV